VNRLVSKLDDLKLWNKETPSSNKANKEKISLSNDDFAQNARNIHFILRERLKYCCRLSEDWFYLISKANIDLNTKKKEAWMLFPKHLLINK
jgi:hypothetical protein